MPSLWGKSSSKDAKMKPSKESFIDILQRKFKSPSEAKLNCKTRGLRRHCSDIVLERGSLSCVASRSPSPSRHVSWCQSFAEKPVAQPLPLPGLHPGNAGCIDTEIRIPTKYWSEKSAKSSLPLPRSACIGSKANQGEIDGYLITASVSKEGSSDSDDLADFSEQSPPATDCGRKGTTTAFSPSSMMPKDQRPTVSQMNRRGTSKPLIWLPYLPDITQA